MSEQKELPRIRVDWQTIELQSKRYWKEIRRGNEKVLRELEKASESDSDIEWSAIFHPFKGRQLKTYNLVCCVCGAILADQPTGRPRVWCEACFKKMRKRYQHERYLERKAKV